MPVTPEDQTALTQPYEIVDDNATGVCPFSLFVHQYVWTLKPADDPTRNPCWCSRPMVVGGRLVPAEKVLFRLTMSH